MSDFAFMEDWDLQAVVRGCTNEASINSMENPLYFFAPLNIQQDDALFSFPSIFETTTVFDELEELCKPFYPVLDPFPPQTMHSTSMSVPQEVEEPEKLQSGSSIGSTPNTTVTTTHAAKHKRSKKNQHKRVVMQVMANALSSDMWAWRKYGQKPIKGSPYPRSYYRCSSSKGCLARKQVERSRSDPDMFLITYTAEHSHAHPARRSSLAGSTRNKFSTPKAPTSSESNMPSVEDNCSPNSTADLSPTTPLMASIEDEFMQHGRIQESVKKEEEQVLEDGDSNEIVMPNTILSDDFIPCLEDFDGLASALAFDGCFSDQFPDIIPKPWFLKQSATVSGSF